MARERVVDIVAKIFDKLVIEKNLNYELVDIEFVKEGSDRFLRLYIDKINSDDKISIDDCEIVSKLLNTKLDEIDPIEENYYLEVSSCGIERPLKKLKDFEKNIGKLAQIKLYYPLNSKKIFEGIIVSIVDDNIIFKDELDNNDVEISFDKIANAKLLFRF